MSIINDVLKSLERRKTVKQEGRFIPMMKPIKSRRGVKWIIYLGLALVVLALGIGVYSFMSFKKQHVTQRVEQVKAHLQAAKLEKLSPLKAQANAAPTVVLANPPLRPSRNSALPPPPDLQANVVSTIKSRPAATADAEKTLTVPLSALQATTSPMASSDDGDFSLVESHSPNEDADEAFNNIEHFAKTGQLKEANRLFNKLPATADSQSKVLLQAQLLSLENKNSQAIQLLEAYNINHDASADDLGMLAALYDLEGRYALAQASYQQLVDYWPESPRWWLGLGITSLHNKQYSQAIASFERVLTFKNALSPEVNTYVHTKLLSLTTDHPTYY